MSIRYYRPEFNGTVVYLVALDVVTYAETTRAFFCSADHHGLFGDPAVQSLLLRLLLHQTLLYKSSQKVVRG